MMTRQEMIDEAVRRVQRNGLFSMGTFDDSKITTYCGVEVHNHIDMVRIEFRCIESEQRWAARSAVAQGT